MSEDTHGRSEVNDYQAGARRFRFKSKKSTENASEGECLEQKSRKRHHRSRRRHHHGSSRKRRRLSTDEPTNPSLDPNAAFRESLFDALADEQGADYWQNVYGQPIHSYSRSYAGPDTGELEVMDDEQYAAHVRRKMWEKSAEGLEAERQARRQQMKDEEKARRERVTQDSGVLGSDTEYAWNGEAPEFDSAIDASLKRGQQRKERKYWRDIWQKYSMRWHELNEMQDIKTDSSADNDEQVFLRNRLAWPVESLASTDISGAEITRFMRKVVAVREDERSHAGTTLFNLLKSERIRWHPDKIQQKFGSSAIERDTMERVTAVFQTLDSMYNDLRSRR